MTTAQRTRPILVTVLVVLVVLGAIGWILTGIVAIVAAGGAGVAVAGIVFVLLGLVYLAVARGLLNGDPRARMVVLVVAALQVVLAIVGLIVTTDQYQNTRSSGSGSGLLALLILVVLFLPKVRGFFGRRTS